MEHLKKLIRHVPDFPKKGILFYDITTLLRDPVGLREALDGMTAPFREEAIDLVVGIESRGFILGAAIAEKLGAGFVPIRKPGKLPGGTIAQSYELEYGSDTLEIHQDAVQEGQRILVRKAGANVIGMAFLVELEFLKGRERLGETPLFVALKYQS